MSNKTNKTSNKPVMSKAEAAERRAADKAALAASKAADKATSKPANKAKPAPRKVSSTVGAPAFAIGQGCRPVSGQRLFAYTAAWLAAFGLDNGKTAPKAAVIKVAGATAIAYHIRQGNMVQTAAGLELTAKGKSVFALRAVDAEMLAAYAAIFKDGQPNAKVGAAKQHIVAVA